MAAGVVDRDLGYADLLKEIRELAKGPHVLVGIREAAGAVKGTRTKHRADGSTYEVQDEATVAEYATFNEFGTRNAPERSFLRSTVNERRDKYAQLLARAVGRSIDGGSFDVELSRVGAVAAADVQNTIRDLQDPPNAASTIKQKGSSNPLIDTGRMRQSIDWETHPAGADSLSPGVGRGAAA